MDHKNRYPKNLQECYTLLKRWKRLQSKQHNLIKVGVLFNTLGDSKDDEGATVMNKGGRRVLKPKKSRLKLMEMSLKFIQSLERLDARGMMHAMRN